MAKEYADAYVRRLERALVALKRRVDALELKPRPGVPGRANPDAPTLTRAGQSAGFCNACRADADGRVPRRLTYELRVGGMVVRFCDEHLAQLGDQIVYEQDRERSAAVREYARRTIERKETGR